MRKKGKFFNHFMIACSYAIEEGRISLEDTLRLKSFDKVGGSGILKI